MLSKFRLIDFQIKAALILSFSQRLIFYHQSELCCRQMGGHCQLLSGILLALFQNIESNVSQLTFRSMVP